MDWEGGHGPSAPSLTTPLCALVQSKSNIWDYYVINRDLFNANLIAATPFRLRLTTPFVTIALAIIVLLGMKEVGGIEPAHMCFSTNHGVFLEDRGRI